VTGESLTPDAELALQAQAGDRYAFDLLVMRSKGPLYRYVRRYIGNDEDAYDIVQDSFISAWLALRRYDARKDFSNWMRVIALNKCRDFGRRQTVRRRFRRVMALFQTEGSLDPSLDASVDGDAGEEERLQRLDRAIADLPTFYKEPLLLTTVGGLSQQETAAQLKTTTKAIEMRIRRAKKKLGEALSDLAGREG
jgi:RNA polymerase sigma factor CnrH